MTRMGGVLAYWDWSRASQNRICAEENRAGEEMTERVNSWLFETDGEVSKTEQSYEKKGCLGDDWSRGALASWDWSNAFQDMESI